MNTKTGEIKTFENQQERDSFIAARRAEGSKGKWWKECAIEPAVKNGMLKGHHPCPCGSGKKFRNCCRVTSQEAA